MDLLPSFAFAGTLFCKTPISRIGVTFPPKHLRFVTDAVKQKLRALVNQGLAEIVDRASVEQMFNCLAMII